MLKTIAGAALAALLLCASLPARPAIADPASNQLVRCSDLLTIVGEGELQWSGSVQSCSNPNLVISAATFASWILNNGSCGTSAMPTFASMTACRVLGVAQTVSVSFYGPYAYPYTNSHGVYACTNYPGYNSYTLPSNTVAPTTVASELSWTPDGSQNQTYRVGFINPSGTMASSVMVSSTTSTMPITYFSSGAPAGAWSIGVTVLSSQTCTGTGSGTTGTQGLASGAAGYSIP